MRRCQRLDIAINTALPPPPKQLRCLALPFLCVGMGQGGQIIWKSKGCIFSEMELIRLYVHREKQFSIIHFSWPKQVTIEHWGGWLWIKKICSANLLFVYSIERAPEQSGVEKRGTAVPPLPQSGRQEKTRDYFLIHDIQNFNVHGVSTII
jgi:hypothetical protein